MQEEEEYDLYRQAGIKDGTRSPTNRLKVFGGLVWRHPHILFLPVAIAGLLIGLGTFAVLKGVDSLKSQARDAAFFDALNTVKTIQLSVQSAVLPVIQLAASISIMPDFKRQSQAWFTNVPVLWQAATEGAVYLRLSPFGRTTAVFPPTPENLALVGTDLLNSTGNRPSALSALARKTFTVTGPALVPSGALLAEFWFPVYFANVSDSETWNIPYQPTRCPAGVCYNPDTRTKWWGFASMGIDTYKFMAAFKQIQALMDKGYGVQLLRPALTGEDIQNEDPDKQEFVNLVENEDSRVAASDALRLDMQMGGQLWQLVVWKRNWYPIWIKWMIAVIVVGALIISGLLLVVLMSRAEHRALLLSLLPKSTIERIRAEADYTTSKQDQDLLHTVSLDTPAQNMMAIIASNVAGNVPPLPILLTVRDALQRSVDLYRPTAEHLKDKIQESEYVDAEVRQALVAQLVGQDRRSDVHQPSLVCLEEVSYVDEHDLDADNAESPTIPASVGAKSYSVKAMENSATSNKHFVGLVSRHASTSACFMTPNGLLAMAPQVKLAPDMQEALWQLMHQVPLSPVDDQEKPGSLKRQGTSEDFGRDSPGAEQRRSGSNKGVQFFLSKQQDKSLSLRSQLSTPSSLTTVEEQQCTRKPVHVRVNMALPSPQPPVIPQVERMLTAANGWSFDAFALDEACNGRPLSVLGYWLMHTTGLKSWARMDAHKLANFLHCVEDGYLDNPYHNKCHAADVLQSMHVIMHRGGLVPGFIDNLTMLACYLAAIIHDYEHRGRNNDYLVNAHDDLAVRYNDRSPMENHHLAAAFALLKRPELNCLSGLTKSAWTKVRKLVIELVLATDMKQHFAIHSQFQNQVVATRPGVNPSHSITSSNFTDVETGGLDGSSLSPASDAERLLTLQMALKCADLGHLTAPQRVHLRWVRALEEEFFIQGDVERDAGLAISPLCDRTKEGITKSQVGFFDFVCVPQFKSFCKRFTQSMPMLDGLKENRAYWKSVARVSEQATDLNRSSRTSRASPSG